MDHILTTFNSSIMFKYLKLIVLVSLPIILLILPANYFDEGASISVFSYFDVADLVYSTGMTRGIMYLIHGDFQMAMSFNKLTIVVLPLLILLWSKMIFNIFNVKILKWI